MHGNAISSTRPKRCKARDRATASLTLGFGHTRGAAPSVSIGPGAIQLTRIPSRAPFARVRNGQVDYAGLGRAVRQHRRRSMHAGGRRDVHDRAGAFLLHELARRRLRAEEHAVKIDSDHRAPSVGRQSHRRRRDTGAVIVDQHVETAELLDRLGHHLVALLGVADVDLRHLAFAAGLANFVAHLLEVLDLAARDQHGRAAQRELFCDRLADSGSAAGHNRNFAFDTEWIVQNENFLRGGSLRFIALLRRVGERRQAKNGRDGDRKKEVRLASGESASRVGGRKERLF